MNRAIDIRQLRYFTAVAQERNFRRAAERLHITQPPLSRQIAELEAQLGVRLLARDSRRVQLTAAGELALREFAKMVDAFDAAVDCVASAAPAASRFRLGVPPLTDLKPLAAVERILKRTGLTTGLDAHALASHEAVAGIRRGDLDAAVIGSPSDTHRLDSMIIGRVRFAAFVPAASPLARRRSVSLQDLLDLPPFFRMRRQSNPPLHDHLVRQFEAHRFRPRVLASPGSIMGVFAQISSGRGCTCMPDFGNYRYRGVVQRPLRENVTADIALIVSPRLDATLRAAIVKAARNLLQEKGRKRSEPVAGKARL